MVAALSRVLYETSHDNQHFSPTTSCRSGKLDFRSQIVFNHHRTGWRDALEAISGAHNDAGIQFDGFIEHHFCWNRKSSRDNGLIPYRNPWVGTCHNPPNIPTWFEQNSAPGKILSTWDMRQSLPNCQGLFVFSEYLRNYLMDLTDVPIVALSLPTQLDVSPFSYDKYLSNPDRCVYQIGSWLRRIHAIKILPTRLKKVWLIGNQLAKSYQQIEYANADTTNEFGEFQIGDYSEISRISNQEYDRILSRNIVFLDLYDASANTTILDCIARSTPVVVNRLPALEEYLGEKYPLFYNDRNDAAEICDDDSRILEGHRYLTAMDKRKFSFAYFRDSFVKSSIYESLPSPEAICSLSANSEAPVDKFETLNLVHGSTLANPYVFVVAFHNAFGNIVNCLRSIVKHHAGYDFSIVLIDDFSNDGSLALAVDFLQRAQCDYVVVSNRKRKYYARNLYNAVNLICTNEESIVIEVDGDDRLEDRDVLECLRAHYDQGALKTVGKFRVHPGEKDYPGLEFVNYSGIESLFNVNRPWNLDRCFSWMHLKSFKRKLFQAVPLTYFLERGGREWLKMAEDLSIHPKMVEIAPRQTRFIDEVLYLYNFSGLAHDAKKREYASYVLSRLYKIPEGSHFAGLTAELLEAERLENQLEHTTPLAIER